MLEDYNIERQPIGMFTIFRYTCYALISYMLLIAIPHFVDFGESWHQQKESDALLFRVIANSNLQKDQHMKEAIVQTVQPLLQHINSLSDGEEVLPVIQKQLQQNYPQHEIHLSVGDHLIPAKYDSAVFYPQNVYQSVVLTIGQGRGDNWFCSIFPKTCEKPEDKKEEKRKFAIFEWLKRKFS